MTIIDFFKLQSKNFLRDYKNRTVDEDGLFDYSNARFFNDIDDIISDFSIDDSKPFSLMNAQHVIANIAGFNKWSDLINSDNDGLELGKLLFEHRNDYIDGYTLWADWDHYLLMNGFKEESNQFKLELFKYKYLTEHK